MKNKMFTICLIISGVCMLVAGYLLLQKKTVIVSFITNNQETLQNVEIGKGKKINLPTLSKEGYEFDGWYVGDVKIDSNYEFNSNTILQAKWIKKQYTVFFDSAAGSSVETQVISNGEKATMPKNPTKSGYIFVEWQLNGNKYDFNTPVTSNITLTAIWKKNEVKITHKVTFVPCCKGCKCQSSVREEIVEHGKKVKRPTDPTKSGYVFLGWLLNGNIYDFNKTVTSDITLEALFAAEFDGSCHFDDYGREICVN